jgi:hypothetical protein
MLTDEQFAEIRARPFVMTAEEIAEFEAMEERPLEWMRVAKQEEADDSDECFQKEPSWPYLPAIHPIFSDFQTLYSGLTVDAVVHRSGRDLLGNVYRIVWSPRACEGGVDCVYEDVGEVDVIQKFRLDPAS